MFFPLFFSPKLDRKRPTYPVAIVSSNSYHNRLAHTKPARIVAIDFGSLGTIDSGRLPLRLSRFQANRAFPQLKGGMQLSERLIKLDRRMASDSSVRNFLFEGFSLEVSESVLFSRTILTVIEAIGCCNTRYCQCHISNHCHNEIVTMGLSQLYCHLDPFVPSC